MKILVAFMLTLATTSAASLSFLPEGRITKGVKATEGQFPYQAGLLLKKNNLKYIWCGGSLISNQWILTAAHCTRDVIEATVFLGSIIHQTGKVTYTVSRQNIIIHQGGAGGKYRNDISLIKIPSTNSSSSIQPIKLSSSANALQANEYVVASGWGDVADNSSVDVEHLQWARMRLMTNAACAKTFSIANSQICSATIGRISPCRGDSGGPLVLESSGVLVGVASYVAKRGCTLGLPAVFTRVNSYLDWIQLHTGLSN